MSEQPKPQKPGVQTSEFWLTIIAMITNVILAALSLMTGYQWAAPIFAAVAVAAPIVYTIGRSLVKGKSPGVLPPLVREIIQAVSDAAKEIGDAAKDKAKPLILLLSAFLLFCIGGCGTGQIFGPAADPKAELLAARHTYNSTVPILTMARRQGAFTKERGEQIGQVVDLAADVLDEWEAVLRLGEQPGEQIEQWRLILRKLIAAQIEAERAKATPLPQQSSTELRPPVERQRPSPKPMPGDPFNEPQPLPPIGAAMPLAGVSAGRRRRRGGVDPLSLLLWGEAVIGLVSLPARVLEIFARIKRGEKVSEEEMAQAAAESRQVRDDYHAAAEFDKPA